MLIALQPGLLSCMAFVLCALTGFILLVRPPHTVRYGHRLLGTAYVLLALCFGLGLFFMAHPQEADHRWYKIPHILWLIYLPMPYLYVRYLYDAKPVGWKDLVHLLPLLVFLIDYLPYFIQGHGIRPTDPMGWSRVKAMIPIWGGWIFPDNFHVPATCLTMALYWIMQVHTLVLYTEQQQPRFPGYTRWLVIYTTLQVPVFIPALLTQITQKPSVWASVVPPATMSILTCITLIMYPRILYGTATAPLVREPSSNPKPSFSDDHIESINREMARVMQEKKPYLDGDYSLQQLADELSMPPHKLSAFINNVNGSNFNDYLNQQRIAYCLDMIASNQTDHLNINGLASLCGFNNRNTFSIAFKKMTGVSPSEYLRSRQKGA